MDNSGVLRYVSIRHSGKSIGAETGNEIQGLTVGGVGAGTTIEYVESFASDDMDLSSLVVLLIRVI